MTNKYYELKQRQQKEVDDFPMMFAFSNSQFDEGMKKLGFEPTEIDKIYSIGAGGYIRKTDSMAFNSMFDKFDEEMKKAIEEDPTGENFIYEMFLYELNNHEYGYTYELDDTLQALDLTREKINKDERLVNGLSKAIKEIKEYDN